MHSLAFSLMLSLGFASAKPLITIDEYNGYHATNSQISATENSTISSSSRLLVTSGSGKIFSVAFDGTAFQITNNFSLPGGGNPSWVVFKEPNLLYAVDENSNLTHSLTYARDTDQFTAIGAPNEGSLGVVHLEFNKYRTRMFGASFTTGSVDIYDSIAADGRVILRGNIPLNDALGPNNLSQTSPQAHQTVLDPMGRYLVVPERGADTLSIIDIQNDSFTVVNSVRVQPGGCGPRHGSFLKSSDGTFATHFVFVCEILNLIQLYLVEYLPDSLKLTHVQSLSTFGDDIPPTNPVVPDPDGAQSAAAGECIVASNQRDIYITNRLTGNPEDSIVRFELLRDSNSEFRASLKFGDAISSFGVSPRMISLSTDEKFIFGTNQANGTGLLAYSRDSAGRLAAIETSKIDIAEFRDSPADLSCIFGFSQGGVAFNEWRSRYPGWRIDRN